MRPGRPGAVPWLPAPASPGLSRILRWLQAFPRWLQVGMSPPSGNVAGDTDKVTVCGSTGSEWSTRAKGRTPEFQTLPMPSSAAGNAQSPQNLGIRSGGDTRMPLFPLSLPEIPHFPANPTQSEPCRDFQPRFPSGDNSSFMDEKEFPKNGAELLMERFPASSSGRAGWCHPSPRG